MTRVQCMVLIAGLTVCCIGLGVATLADPSPKLSEEQTGDREISEYLADNANPGFRSLSAFVLRDGQAMFGGLGTGADDEFEIASVTKTFTADLLRQQLESGDISSSTTVAEVLGGEFTNAPAGDVTVLELAEHTSGLPRLGDVGLKPWLAPFFNRNPYGDISDQDALDLAAGASLKDRGHYRYSNLGYALLGQVLAANMGVTYPALLQEAILEPLGMDATYPMTPGSVATDAPRGGESSDSLAQPWEMEGFLSAAGLRSTPRDMAVYAQYLLDSGLPDFTWERDEASGAYWHNGESFGFSSVLIIHPEAHTATFVISDTPKSVVTSACLSTTRLSLRLPRSNVPLRPESPR